MHIFAAHLRGHHPNFSAGCHPTEKKNPPLMMAGVDQTVEKKIN